MARRVTLLKFKLNKSRTGIKGLAVDPRLQAACRDIAETRARPYAMAASPEESGSYAASFQVEDIKVHGIPKRWPMTHAGAALVNRDSGATAIEVGSARRTQSGEIVATPANWVLRRTLEHLDALSGRRRRQQRDIQ
ncbi:MULTISPECIES: hypothetical protein [unclassified Micromonospora]|uniref:hypothetical protein n=1 Tax=unclassified Micromonospora TaxID=2617518 RepID=UPI00331B5CE3